MIRQTDHNILFGNESDDSLALRREPLLSKLCWPASGRLTHRARARNQRLHRQRRAISASGADVRAVYRPS